MGVLTYESTLAGISWQTSQGRMACRGDQHKQKLCSCLCCWFLLLLSCISLSYFGCFIPETNSAVDASSMDELVHRLTEE